MPRFSSANRITPAMVENTKYDLVSGAYGSQLDCQCIGYDRLCALAALFYDEAKKGGVQIDSYKAVNMARDEVHASAYSRGFHNAWDKKKQSEVDAEYVLGFTDGEAARAQYNWRGGRVNDMVGR